MFGLNGDVAGDHRGHAIVVEGIRILSFHGMRKNHKVVKEGEEGVICPMHAVESSYTRRPYVLLVH